MSEQVGARTLILPLCRRWLLWLHCKNRRCSAQLMSHLVTQHTGESTNFCMHSGFFSLSKGFYALVCTGNTGHLFSVTSTVISTLARKALLKRPYPPNKITISCHQESIAHVSYKAESVPRIRLWLGLADKYGGFYIMENSVDKIQKVRTGEEEKRGSYKKSKKEKLRFSHFEQGNQYQEIRQIHNILLKLCSLDVWQRWNAWHWTSVRSVLDNYNTTRGLQGGFHLALRAAHQIHV